MNPNGGKGRRVWRLERTGMPNQSFQRITDEELQEEIERLERGDPSTIPEWRLDREITIAHQELAALAGEGPWPDYTQ